MSEDRETTTNAPFPPCHEPKHRVIPLRFPYAEAKAIHVRLITEVGPARVSRRLREIEGGWEVVICPACGGGDPNG
jgi:hypothetical protein